MCPMINEKLGWKPAQSFLAGLTEMYAGIAGPVELAKGASPRRFGAGAGTHGQPNAVRDVAD